jgi:hypothetical protein
MKSRRSYLVRTLLTMVDTVFLEEHNLLLWVWTPGDLQILCLVILHLPLPHHLFLFYLSVTVDLVLLGNLHHHHLGLNLTPVPFYHLLGYKVNKMVNHYWFFTTFE